MANDRGDVIVHERAALACPDSGRGRGQDR